TGAIGFIEPNNDFCFNVAIRTLVVTPDKRISLGVGGGILYDSLAGSEYEECATKSSFVNRLNSDFALIETFASRKEGSPTLELHLKRLENSAQVFGFQFDREKIKKEILDEQRDLSGGEHKLRLLLFQDGDIEITSQPIPTPSEKCRVGISRRAIDSRDIFYKHKTTARELYDDEYEAAQKKGLYDVIFLNEMGFVAEASRHTIFIKKNGQFWTPPLSSGALPGIRRALQIQEWHAEEKDLSLNDLREAQEIYLTNSVRGVVKVSHLESL
ncbi:MAG: aminotransferase class IV, partial [Bdellovibrionales bacterium]|nr:aminotransferase class IV [Bdellovibrionales bacterium]